jgi:hypothetical protein
VDEHESCGSRQVELHHGVADRVAVKRLRGLGDDHRVIARLRNGFVGGRLDHRVGCLEAGAAAAGRREMILEPPLVAAQAPLDPVRGLIEARIGVLGGTGGLQGLARSQVQDAVGAKAGAIAGDRDMA